MVNLVSGYLFSLRKINLTTLVFIIVGSISVIIIISIQLKTNSFSERIDTLESENKKLTEKLKIHKQFIDIKADIKELQKRYKI